MRPRLALALLGGIIWTLLLAPAAGAAPPAGFEVTPVVEDLETPVAIDFAPDGTMFIAEKRGVVRVYRNGSLLPTPFIDISDDVNDRFEHGMLGLAVHPSFPTVPFVYVLYTHDPPGLPKDEAGARVARLERISADPLNPYVAASGGSAREVILGRNANASAIPDPTPPPSGTPGKPSCVRNGLRVEDCIPQDGTRHQIGTVAFGADGMLYAGNGDVERLPSGPLNPASHIGAIMRIDPLTGLGLPDNPFWNGNPASNLSKTWVHGLRNPFRFNVDPATGQMFIGDVGAHTWESIQLGQAGKNYGWPCYEAGAHVYGIYQNSATCQAQYAIGPRPPLYEYRHTAAGGSITVGDWYHGTSYPAAYRNAHFFADYSQGWLKYIRPDGFGGYAVADFATDSTTSGIVQLLAAPNTDLYWVSINNSAVYRLRYTGAPPALPPDPVSLRFEEGQGTTAADSSGNGNAATLRNGAGWSAGRIGGGLALDGADDFGSIESSPSLGYADALTVAGWVRRPAVQPGWRQLASRQLTTTAADQFLLGFKDGTPYFGVNTDSGGLGKVGSGSATVGDWVHLAGVYDGSKITLYVNGVKRGSAAKTGKIAASARPILIGANANTSNPLAASENIGGGLDEVRVFSTALSDAEIAALANPVEPPQVTITSPADDSRFNVGTEVAFTGQAEDEIDGDLTDQISWDAILHHNVHTHPDLLPITVGAGGSFELPDHDDDTYIELCANATNTSGVTGTGCIDIRPETTTVTIDSVPSGIDVSFDEITAPAPFTIESNTSAGRVLSAPETSGCYSFESWSDGGTISHQITVPASTVTYTARFANTCPDGGARASLRFEEGQGTTAADSSGNGNAATLRNGAGWSAGRIGGGLALDGADDFGSIESSPSLGYADALTVAGWVRRPAVQPGWRQLASRQLTTTAADQFLLGFKDGTPYFGVNTDSGGLGKVGSGSATVGDWVHLAGVYDGSKITLYVNGVKRGSAAKTGKIAASARPILIGANANTSNPLAASENIGGGLDEVRVFSTALSDAEIAALASGF